MPEILHLATSGKETDERILRSAVKLFSANWYGSVSVAEICRDACLSNGVFYRYYHNKAELCKTILGATQEGIASALKAVNGDTSRARLEQFVEIVMDFSLVHPDLIAVFREGQFRFIEYERSLETLYQRSLSRVLGTEIGVAESMFALGGIRYCAIRRGLQGAAIDPSTVLAIIEHGFFPGLAADLDRVFEGPVSPLPLSIDESARNALLKEGKRLFGKKDFVDTNIYEITDAAGVAVGTFYTYFPSKESFFGEIIRNTGHDLRRFISTNMPEGLNRLEREMRGLWLCIIYLQSDVPCYNIVRQAEFVLPQAARSYYAAFVQGYAKRPLSSEGLAPGLDEATAVEFLLGVGHYLGIETIVSESTGSLRAKIETIGHYFAIGFSERLAS